jgi:hypothetical protein
VLAALIGTMGDYLATTGNPLAISMQLRRKGQPLTSPRRPYRPRFLRLATSCSSWCMACA